MKIEIWQASVAEMPQVTDHSFLKTSLYYFLNVGWLDVVVVCEVNGMVNG